jgi:hypothetical protein
LDALLSLFPSGLTVDPKRSLRDLADDLNTDPEGVIEMLNERARAERPIRESESESKTG